MYVFYKRTLPHPNLDTFDCPDSITALMGREISNTPLQALVVLNNEVHVESGPRFREPDPQRWPTGRPRSHRQCISTLFESASHRRRAEEAVRIAGDQPALVC